MTPSESTTEHTTEHTTLGNPPHPPYPSFSQTRTLNNFGFELPVSLENLFPNDAASFNVAQRPVYGALESSSTSPTSAENSYTNHDYCDQTVPGSYYQSNYITMKPEPSFNFDALAPSFFYPAMIPSDGSLPHGHARGSADNGYSLLSYGNNTSSSPFQEDTVSNYARRHTEPNMGMLSPRPTPEWGYRQSVMSTRSNYASSPNYEASSDSFFACPVCDKSFAKRHSLKLHMRSHSTDKPFKCSLCEKTFARCHDMKRHQQLHKGVKVFRCEGHLRDGVTKWGCGKKFARSDALTRHLRAGAGRRCLKPLVDESRAFDMHPLVQAASLNNSDLADAPGRPMLSMNHA